MFSLPKFSSQWEPQGAVDGGGGVMRSLYVCGAKGRRVGTGGEEGEFVAVRVTVGNPRGREP